MPLLFFGTYDAADVGIPRLQVGADRDLGGGPVTETPVIRVRGEDRTGGLLFDHIAPTLTPYQLHMIERLIDAKRGGQQFFDVDELADLEAMVRTALEYLDRERRLVELVRQLKPNEALTLSDEGGSTITALWAARTGHGLAGNAAIEYAIHRWDLSGLDPRGTGDPIAHADTPEKAVAIATSDLGLPRTEPVARER